MFSPCPAWYNLPVRNSGRERSRAALKAFLQSLDRKVLNRDTRAKGVTVAYMAVAILLLLHHVYVTVYHKSVLTGARDLYIPFILFAGASFFMGKLWKDKLFWVFAVLLVLKVARTALFGTYALTVSVTYFVLSVYAFFICYAIGRVLPREMWKPFLSVLCFLWTVAAVIYAAFGLKVAFTGVPIPNLGTTSFMISPVDHRLYLVYHAVSSGVLLASCMSVAVLGLLLSKNILPRIFYAAAALVLFFTCSLTGTRTAFVMCGVNLALLLCLPLYDRLKPGLPGKRLLDCGKLALVLLSALVLAAGIAYAQSRAVHLMNSARVQGLLIPAAFAEGEAAPVLNEIQERGFDLAGDEMGFLNGRYTQWDYVLKVAFSSPKDLLLGQSVYNTMVPITELRAADGLPALDHCHNIFLQYLTENGLPGLLLYCAFIFTFLFHAGRVLTNRKLPFWQRALPVCAIICVLEGLVDNTCHVNFGYPQMTALYLFSGLTITLSREEAAKKKLSHDKS